MQVLICFDKFKDSMSAQEAGRIAEKAIVETHADWTVETVALADGGEGFCEILTSSHNGMLEVHSVPGSLLQPVQAQLGWVAGRSLSQKTRADWELNDDTKLAIIEMAQATGLQELPIDERNCWKTTSLGTGELMRKAIEKGADLILLGVGGSSTNDLGLGVLEALGLRFYNDANKALRPIRPELWNQITRIEGLLPNNLPPLKIACDVQNPLFGPLGAAAIYGPQKGLKPEDHDRMETLGKKIAKLLCAYMGKPWSLTSAPGSGAAGGITFGLSTACDVELISGFDLVSQWLDLSEKIEQCDWLITGEGKFDDSSLQGKGPGTLAKKALAIGKRVSILAGRMEVGNEAFSSNGPLNLVEISPRNLELETALLQGPENLANAVLRLMSNPE